jgi:hypothetical protein
LHELLLWHLKTLLPFLQSSVTTPFTPGSEVTSPAWPPVMLYLIRYLPPVPLIPLTLPSLKFSTFPLFQSLLAVHITCLLCLLFIICFSR